MYGSYVVSRNAYIVVQRAKKSVAMLRPYMWIRCTYMPVRCSHYINISISATLSRVLIGGRSFAAFLVVAFQHLASVEGGLSSRKWLHPVKVTTGNTLPRGLVPTVSASAKDIDSLARCSEAHQASLLVKHLR